MTMELNDGVLDGPPTPTDAVYRNGSVETGVLTDAGFTQCSTTAGTLYCIFVGVLGDKELV